MMLRNILRRMVKMGIQHQIEDYLDDRKHSSHNVRDTSRESYHDLLSHPIEINGRRLEVLKALREIGVPSTDQEIKKHLNKSEPNYVRPRRNELVELLLVESCFKRECNVTGKKVYTWKITELGINFLNGGSTI